MTSIDKKNHDRTKKSNLEASIEELLKTEKIILDNGKTHPMFARFRSKIYWIYLCFPCGATCSGEDFLQSHLRGKKHSYHKNKTAWPEKIVTNHPYFKLQKDANVKLQCDTSSESLLSLDLNLVVAPGEPVPPGIEVESQLDGILKNHKKPIVGLEYIIEIVNEMKFEREYFCSLCDSSMYFLHVTICHLDGFRHKQKYMSINYPSAFRLMYELTSNNKSQLHIGSVKVFNNICKCIEEAYGRLKPTVLNKTEFESNRIKYIKEIHQGKHFNQNDGATFEELVDLDYIKIISESSNRNEKNSEFNTDPDENMQSTSSDAALMKRKRDKKERVVMKGKQRSDSLDSISSLSDVSEDDEVYVVLDSTEEKSIDGNDKTIAKHPRNRIYRNNTGLSSEDDRYRESTPLQDENQNGQIPLVDLTSASGDKLKKIQWEIYRTKMKQIVDEAKDQLEFHEKFPEKHPHYDEEWKKFWSKSYRNFEIEKKDIWQYDLKPDWIKCWRKIMLDMHNEALALKRRELLTELHLVSDDESDVSRNKTLDSMDNRKIDDHSDSQNRDRIRRDRSRERNYEVSPIRNRDNFDRNRIIRRERSPIDKRSERSYEDRRCDRSMEDKRRDRSIEVKRHDRSLEDKRHDRSLEDKRRDRSMDRDNRKRDRDDDRRNITNRSRDHNERDAKFRRRNSPSPRRDNRRNNRAGHEDSENEKMNWYRYHRKMNFYMLDITKIYRKHEESPEHHPLFNVEYEKFKNRKLSENDNVSMDDPSVQSEWSKLWVSKLRSFKSGEILMKKKSLIKELGLKNVRGVNSNDDEMDIYKDCEPIRSRSPAKSDKRSQNSRHEKNITQEELKDLNVVIVLRHLTALENYLGSLGPKVVDLLGTALKMEKVKPNSSEDILACDEYCVLLETVKEKLKGQLMAKLIDSHAEPAAKLAITYVASMVHKATKIAEMKKINDKTNGCPVTVAGIGAVEKAAIANQIATALVAQGKSDVTTEELEYLINAVVGIANASQSSNKSLLNNCDLLAQLTEKRHNDQKIADDVKNGLEMLQSAYDKNIKTSNPPAPVGNDSFFDDRLNDSDLKTLLQNFKHLSADEQHGLINYLKKLEAIDSARVEQLRKVINMDSLVEDHINTSDDRSHSPFSSQPLAVNPPVKNAKITTPTKLFTVKDSDDDDEDYNYDEVIKSAAEKIKKQKLKEEMDIIKQSLIDSAAETKNELKENPEPNTIVDDTQIVPPNEAELIDHATKISIANVLNLVKNAGINLIMPQTSTANIIVPQIPQQQNPPHHIPQKIEEPMINYTDTSNMSPANNERPLNNYRPPQNAPQNHFNNNMYSPGNNIADKMQYPPPNPGFRQDLNKNIREPPFIKPQFQNNQEPMPNHFPPNNQNFNPNFKVDNNFIPNRIPINTQPQQFPNQFSPGFNNPNNFGGVNNFQLNNMWNQPRVNAVAGFPSSSSLGNPSQFRTDNAQHGNAQHGNVKHSNARGRGRGNLFQNNMGINRNMKR